MSVTTTKWRGKTFCFVPGCKSGHLESRIRNRYNGIKNPTLFKPPKDTKMLNKWENAICRADRTMESTDVVCELHFQESDIKRSYETKLCNGTIHKIERGTPRLKKTAVPSIFANSTQRLTTVVPGRTYSGIRKPRKTTKTNDEAHVFNEQTNENTDVCEIIEPEEITFLDVESDTKFSFFTLITNLDLVVLPSTKWTKAYWSKFNNLVIAEWSDPYHTSKRVIIHPNLSMQVFVHDVEIYHDVVKKTISSFQELIDCLKIIDDTLLFYVKDFQIGKNNISN